MNNYIVENKQVKKHACHKDKQAEKSLKLKSKWQSYTEEEKQARLKPMLSYWDNKSKKEYTEARLGYWNKLSGEERKEFCRKRAEKKKATVKAKLEANRPHESLILPWEQDSN